MTDVLRLDDARVVVPDNRWDLVQGPGRCPTVGVVVPYYDQPAQLALVLAALAAQNYPRELLHVVVADDGSAVPPDVERWRHLLSVTVVAQEDRGFRAAAARNLGARAATGEVLCFLDADTVPTPDYIRRAVRLPSLIPDAIVVGRRKHGDLSDVAEGALQQWFSDHSQVGDEFEPEWLVDGYARTSGFMQPGWDGYKYVLSAVLTCSRELFDAVGGFEESFVEYGGEDWELANRAFMMGAVFAYEPAALAWHDGPDWAVRDVEDRTTKKNAEALALAQFVTDPAARTLGLRYRVPDVVARVRVDGHSAASLAVTIASIVDGSDCAVQLVGSGAKQLYDTLRLHDSRIEVGEPEEDVLARCRFVLDVVGRAQFSPTTMAALTDQVGPGKCGRIVVDAGSVSVTLTASRAIHRASRWAMRLGLSETDLVERLFGIARRSADEVGITVAADEPWLSW
ncbi:glycosyltransferase [Rhodococcoides kyotonense]|uniref:Glycosyltransferase, GT2 family n=1 Tax=Rhodococcoides kyotonense TaxID=398843 RepID=A0A239MHW2_9NOCA|nr:glycosyltransferase [Rhodococcus kyotonensis]SNT42090.1 Glycosyltransferase, GT2 family [Rhodococcus kyotonensis]